MAGRAGHRAVRSAMASAVTNKGANSMSQTVETATLGGGCFWCLEALYLRVEGVNAVESGYAGGHVANPSYEQVCDGDTGHAEVVKVEFDPAKITYREILD